MKPSFFLNKFIAKKYLKKPELIEFLNFQYPSLPLQFAGFINELCYHLQIYYAPFIRSAAFEVTNVCNLNCTVCPQNTNDFRKKGFMDFNLFRHILDNNKSLNLVQCNGWGEPFKHPQIIDFITYAKSKGKRVYLYSNGTLINEKLADEILESGLDRIIFSLDGIGDTYEKIRGYSYEKIEDQILLLIKKRKISNSNLIIDVSMVGSKDTENDIKIFKNKWKHLVNGIQILSYFDHTKKNRNSKCRELWRGNPQILWDGTVTVCCVDWGGEFNIAKIGPNGFNLQKIWNSEKIKTLRLLHTKNLQ
ncbi:radical SAM/SPASM domain-containing protein [Chlamydiota bacterium]